MEFKPGDMAVYPGHGVGTIEKIEDREVGDVKQYFYIMRVLDSDLTIMIPITNTDNVGLRSIIDREEAAEIYSILEEKEPPSTSETWNRRYRTYMDKIRTGSPRDLAEVFRDLCLIKSDRELSFGERKVLGVAQNLLVKELTLAEDTEEQKVTERLEKIFD